MDQPTRTRKSLLNLQDVKEGLAQPSIDLLAAAAAEADGVTASRRPMARFNSVNADTVSAAQKDVGRPAVVSSSKVVTEIVSAEFDVELSLVDPLPTNSRFDYTEDEINKMLADLQREGKQLKPMELTPHDEIPGRYYAVDGYTRRLALAKWGKSHGRAVLVEVTDPWARYKASWYANNGSRHTTDYDNGMRWRDMIDKGIINQPQISVELGEKFSAGNVSRILSVAKLPESVRDLIRENKHKLSSSFYYSIFQLMGELTGPDAEKKAVAFLKVALAEDLSYREFQQRIDRHLQAPDADLAPPVAVSKVADTKPLLFSGREVGAIKEWAAGDKLQISLKKVPADVREQVKDAVRKILEAATVQASAEDAK